MMKDKIPKKKLKSKKAEKFTPNTDDSIKELTEKALTSFLKEQINSKNDLNKNLDALSSVIEEFLSSYIILGYTFDGKPVNIIYAHNQQEADSLTTIINKFIQNMSNNDE